MASAASELPLRCPDCSGDRFNWRSEEIVCTECGEKHPVLRSRPVFVRADNHTFPRQAYTSSLRPSRRQRRLTLPASVNLSFAPSLRRMARDLPAGARVLLVGAGDQRPKVERALAPASVVAIDVDVAADVDIYCDVHDLPFADASFDAVVSTAVLEHVVHPERGMSEIWRVLRPRGLLYSEIPFMQQVHEGPYDFTRFTLSGHRMLAAGFDELDSGVTAGPCTAFVWSLEHLLFALLNGRARRMIKLLMRLSMLWFVQLDRLMGCRPASIDAASCTYFLGARREAPVPDEELIRSYPGAQRASHL